MDVSDGDSPQCGWNCLDAPVNFGICPRPEKHLFPKAGRLPGVPNLGVFGPVHHRRGYPGVEQLHGNIPVLDDSHRFVAADDVLHMREEGQRKGAVFP